MTVSWDGLRTRLAANIGADDEELTVRFTDGWESKTPPFDVGMGLERITVNAIAGTAWSITRGVNGSTPVPHYQRATITELRHEILVRKGSALWDCSLIADKSFGHGSAIPVGETECGIAFETTEDGWVPDIDSTLVLSSNESGAWAPYYSGLLQRPSYVERDDGSLAVSLTARGLGHSTEFDEYVQTTAPGASPDTFDDGIGWWRAFTAGHTIIEDVLRDLCPLISGDSTYIVDGDQSLGKEYNGRTKKARAIIDEICAQGDAGEALDWAVYTGPDAEARFYLYRRDRWPTISLAWSTVAKAPNEIPLAWDSDEVKTRIVVYFSSGVAFAEGPGEIVRTQSFHCENTIDDLATAQYIANTILAQSSVLQMLTESPIVLTYKADDPSTHYVTDALSGDEIPLWRIRAGWLVQFPDLVARNASLPITPIQIKSCRIDHFARTATLQLGTFWDYAKIASLYSHESSQAPNSPTHLPGVVGTVAVPPDGAPLPGSLSPSVPSLGTGGRIGYDKVAEDADISEVVWPIMATDVIPTGRGLQPDFPIHLNGQIVGFRMTARDGTEPSGVVSLEIEVGYTAAADVPNIGTTFSTLSISAGNKMTPVDLNPDLTVPQPGTVQPVNAGDHLTWNVTANDAAQLIEIAVLFRRTEGSDRAADPDAPSFVDVEFTRDPDNNGVISIVTNKTCTVQAEYGTTTGYGTLSQKTEVARQLQTITIKGLPEGGGHFRVHAKNANGHEAISSDYTFS